MKKGVIILAAALLLVTGCGEPVASKQTGNVLKTVGTEKITDSDVKRELDNMPQQYKSYYDTEDGKKKIVDKLAEQKMLKQEGIKLKMDQDKDYLEELEVTKERTLASFVIKKKILDAVKVTDEEAKKEFETKKEMYKTGEQVSASHILIKANEQSSKEDRAKAKSKAEGLLKDALAGQDFIELAKKNSEDGSASQGGSLGWFEKEKMVKPFSDAAFTGEKGKVYPKVVETQFGYHIIKVDDKKEAGYKSFEEVKEQLKEELISKKRMDEYNKWMDGLKKQYMK